MIAQIYIKVINEKIMVLSTRYMETCKENGLVQILSNHIQFFEGNLHNCFKYLRYLKSFIKFPNYVEHISCILILLEFLRKMALEASFCIYSKSVINRRVRFLEKEEIIVFCKYFF